MSPRKGDKVGEGSRDKNPKEAPNNCQKEAQIVTVTDHLGAAAGFVSLP